MTTPTFTPPPTTPARTMKPAAVFSAAVKDFLAWFVTFRGELATGVGWMATTAAQVAADMAAAASAALAAGSARTDAETARNQAVAAAATAAASSGSAAGFTATSPTPLTIGSGVKTFFIQQSKSFQPGEVVRVVDQANVNNWMSAPVDSYNAGNGQMQMTVGAGDFSGSGSISAWNVSLSGQKGATGSGYTGGKLSAKLEFTNRVSIAAGATVDIGGAASNAILVTGGPATISSFGTGGNGVRVTVEFAGANTLVNGANLVLLGAQDLATAAGDVGEFISIGGTSWKMTGFARAAETPGGGQAGDLLLALDAVTPVGYLPADGATVSQTTYAKLFPKMRQMFAGFSAPVQRAFTKHASFPNVGIVAAGDTVWTGDRQAYLYCTMDGSFNYHAAIATSTNGASVTNGAGAPFTYAFAVNSSEHMSRLVALGNAHLWAFSLNPNNPRVFKTTDAMATAPWPVSFSGYPAGASAATVLAAGGNRTTGVLAIGGAKTGAPFLCTVNTGTNALTERTLPAISGAASVAKLEWVTGTIWAAYPDNNTASYWRSTDDGASWAVNSMPAASSGTGARVQAVNGRLFHTAPATGLTYWTDTAATGGWTLLPLAAAVEKHNLDLLRSTNYVGGQTPLTGVQVAKVAHMAATWWFHDGLNNVWASDDCRKVAKANASGLSIFSGHFAGVGAQLSTRINVQASSWLEVAPISHDSATQFRLPALNAADFHPLTPFLKVA